jgi:hypothetical protein
VSELKGPDLERREPEASELMAPELMALELMAPELMAPELKAPELMAPKTLLMMMKTFPNLQENKNNRLCSKRSSSFLSSQHNNTS